MGARHGDTAANHTDLQSGCGRTCVFAVQALSNLWDPISERPSHYSMRAARNYLSSSTLVCYDAQIKSNDTRTHLVRYLTFTAEGSKTEKRKCLQRSLRTFLYVLCVLFLKCDIVHRCHNNKHNKLALLWGEAQLCLPYVPLKKEKNTIIKFIDGNSTHNVKTQNKKIKKELCNFRFSIWDFENNQNIENNISFRSSFKSEIVSNLTAASGI